MTRVTIYRQSDAKDVSTFDVLWYLCKILKDMGQNRKIWLQKYFGRSHMLSMTLLLDQF